jgi:NlpA lipoprotein
MAAPFVSCGLAIVSCITSPHSEGVNRLLDATENGIPEHSPWSKHKRSTPPHMENILPLVATCRRKDTGSLLKSGHKRHANRASNRLSPSLHDSIDHEEYPPVAEISDTLAKLTLGRRFSVSKFDIVENPKNLKIFELDPAQNYRSLDDVALALVNITYLILAGGDPKSALIIDRTLDNGLVIDEKLPAFIAAGFDS